MNEILEGQKYQQPSSMITIIGRFDDFTDMAVDISPQLQLAKILGFDSSGNMRVKLSVHKRHMPGLPVLTLQRTQTTKDHQIIGKTFINKDVHITLYKQRRKENMAS
jgi:hypothetical protein